MSLLNNSLLTSIKSRFFKIPSSEVSQGQALCTAIDTPSYLQYAATLLLCGNWKFKNASG